MNESLVRKGQVAQYDKREKTLEIKSDLNDNMMTNSIIFSTNNSRPEKWRLLSD